MEGRKKYLKGLAFLPAIVLVGGFVGCRAGAFQMFSNSEPQPESTPQAPTNAPAAAESQPPVFFSGSKSPNLPGITAGLTPGSDTATSTNPPGVPSQQPKPEKPPTFMSGSKSTWIYNGPVGPTPSEPSKPAPNALPGGPNAP